MAVSPEEQTEKMVAGLKESTGRTLAEWSTAVKKSGKAKHGELVTWLKAEHGVTHGYANLIAHKTLASDSGSRVAAGDDLVAEMLSGDKAVLRPIFDALMARILTFGGDVEQAPKKGYLSLRRKTQFATLHPSTKTRFDVGLKLKGVEPSGRLEAAGSWNAMMTHRVRLASVDDVNDELFAMIRAAYDGA